jgi:hypothetical protein
MERRRQRICHLLTNLTNVLRCARVSDAAASRRWRWRQVEERVAAETLCEGGFATANSSGTLIQHRASHRVAGEPGESAQQSHNCDKTDGSCRSSARDHKNLDMRETTRASAAAHKSGALPVPAAAAAKKPQCPAQAAGVCLGASKRGPRVWPAAAAAAAPAPCSASGFAPVLAPAADDGGLVAAQAEQSSKAAAAAALCSVASAASILPYPNHR